MILTEEEAKTKWCPNVAEAAVSTPDGDVVTGINRMTDGAPYNCLASGCMAWRWHNSPTPMGYCGKAGKPHGK